MCTEEVTVDSYTTCKTCNERSGCVLHRAVTTTVSACRECIPEDDEAFFWLGVAYSCQKFKRGPGGS